MHSSNKTNWTSSWSLYHRSSYCLYFLDSWICWSFSSGLLISQTENMKLLRLLQQWLTWLWMEVLCNQIQAQLLVLPVSNKAFLFSSYLLLWFVCHGCLYLSLSLLKNKTEKRNLNTSITKLAYNCTTSRLTRKSKSCLISKKKTQTPKC